MRCAGSDPATTRRAVYIYICNVGGHFGPFEDSAISPPRSRVQNSGLEQRRFRKKAGICQGLFPTRVAALEGLIKAARRVLRLMIGEHFFKFVMGCDVCGWVDDLGITSVS